MENTKKLTINDLINICEREYKRGMATADTLDYVAYNYDYGYATAFKLCLALAKEVKESLSEQSRKN